MKVILLVMACTGLTGCMSDATQQRFVAEGNNAALCKAKVLDARIAIAAFKSQPNNQVSMTFKNDQNALIAMMIQQMGNMNVAMIEAFTGKSDGIESCDAVIVAMVKADAAKVAGLNNAGMTAIKWTAGLVGLGILSDGWGASAYSSGTGSTTNIHGSRVVTNSDNYGNGSISASGEGLGVANTYGGQTNTTGGILPRSIDIGGNTNASTSNSGEQTNNAAILEE